MVKERQVEVAIIGAGTAGLSACSEVRKATEGFVVINGGPAGTTCARVGCMPSKVLIQVANDFHRRHVFHHEGIEGAEHLRLDQRRALQHVRSLRDSFVRGVLGTLDELGEHYVQGYPRFVEPTVLALEGQLIRARRVIIATGSHPLIPEAWPAWSDRILTTDTLYEQEHLPASLAVTGLGPVGVEMGQALSRLGVQVTGISRTDWLAGLTDPEVNAYCRHSFAQEFTLHTATISHVEASDMVHLHVARTELRAEKLLVSVGRRANTAGLGLEALGVPLDERGLPAYDPTTMQIAGLPIFLAGDVTSDRPLLHEAADEGRIAGFNSVRAYPHCFQRRVPLSIVFCEPNVAVVGQSFAALQNQDIAIGEVRFDNQGRARVLAENTGMLRVYAAKPDGRLVGAELMAPRGEHLAHLLAWVMQKELTVFDVLQLPFYHPVVEEGVRTALRDLAKQLQVSRPASELVLCDSVAIGTLG